MKTLVNITKIVNDDTTREVLQSIVDLDPFYSVLPFYGYEGREILTEKGSYGATRLVGDGEVVEGRTSTFDELAIEIMSKAKSIGRLFQTGIATGTGFSPQMNSFPSMITPQQTIIRDQGYNLSLSDLDALKAKVTAKDGQLDFYMMSSRTIRSYKILLREIEGAVENYVVTLPDDRTVISYGGVPIFRNNYLSTTETLLGDSQTGGTMASIWAGCFDTGNLGTGICAIHPIAAPGGVVVKPIGGDKVTQVSQYTNLANFNPRALARLSSVLN